MKDSNPAPMFACLYPALAEVARAHGYCLAIHGSVVTDLDLVAVPWVENAGSAEQLKDALFERIGAVGYADLVKRQVGNAQLAERIVQAERARTGQALDDAPEQRPHGRLSWNLYLDLGIKIDLSVMPRTVRA